MTAYSGYRRTFLGVVLMLKSLLWQLASVNNKSESEKTDMIDCEQCLKRQEVHYETGNRK